MVPTLRWGLLRSNFSLAIGLLGRFLSLSVWARRTQKRVRLLAAHPLDDVFLNVRRGLVVSGELHRVRRPTLGPRTEVGSVTEHLRERDLSADDLRGAALLHALHLTAAAVEVADHVAH